MRVIWTYIYVFKSSPEIIERRPESKTIELLSAAMFRNILPHDFLHENSYLWRPKATMPATHGGPPVCCRMSSGGVHSKHTVGWLQVACSLGKSEQSQKRTLIGGSFQLRRYKNTLVGEWSAPPGTGQEKLSSWIVHKDCYDHRALST